MEQKFSRFSVNLTKFSALTMKYPSKEQKFCQYFPHFYIVEIDSTKLFLFSKLMRMSLQTRYIQSYCQRRSVNCRVHFFFSNQYSSFCRSGKIQADLAINLTAEMSWNHHSASDLHKPTQPACRYQYDSSKIKTKKIPVKIKLQNSS